MTNRSPMHQQIDTLPDLIRDIVKPFDASARHAFPCKVMEVDHILPKSRGDTADVGASHWLARKT